jgi:hypothetical protein
MKKSFLSFCTLILSVVIFAQSKYDHKEAFNPQFYPYPGNDFRSASGEPGPKYWQNRADYKISCTLDTASHGVVGEVEIRIFIKKIPVPQLPLHRQAAAGPMQNSPMVM